MQAKTQKIYIIDGSRTPFLKSRGIPGQFSAADLAVQTGSALLARQHFNPDQLDEVIIGCVSPASNEANIARLIALRLGCGEQMPAWTVQRNCASGMQAIDAGVSRIKAGQAKLVLVGGTEAMSRYPILVNHSLAVWLNQWMHSRTVTQKVHQLSRLHPTHFQFIMSLLQGLTDPVVNLSMGQTAELLAHQWQISRQDMDDFALQSHQRLANAVDHDYLSEITPLYSPDGVSFCHDDGLRRQSNPTDLATLRAVFDLKYGTVTAGNSAQITDGAALMILASEQAVDEFHLDVRAEIIDTHWAAIDPAQMGLGPIYAMLPIMQRQKLITKHIDYWEINEAFAAQVLACLTAWDTPSWCQQMQGGSATNTPIPNKRLNTDGGSISIGHPLGATGVRIVLHLLHLLERTHTQRGIASLCIGGGQGGALLLQRGES